MDLVSLIYKDDTRYVFFQYFVLNCFLVVPQSFLYMHDYSRQKHGTLLYKPPDKSVYYKTFSLFLI